MEQRNVDLLVIGGGINGTAIAADAASRGLRVLLCERNDLASETSSWSSKLIHGGLRYLEQKDFLLVRESLKEQQILLRRAPHLVKPIQFILPHDDHLRPKWMIRLGLFLYDHLANRGKLPRSKQVNLQRTPQGLPLKSKYQFGFSYYDCTTDDSRLVLANAKLAEQYNAKILTRYECTDLKQMDDHWQATLINKINEEPCHVKAKAVINAAGPWVVNVLQKVAQINPIQHIKLVKGSHIILPKFYEGDHAYILQAEDNRIVFVIPYLNNFLLIGTTDVEYSGDPHDAEISTDEINYLCDCVNQFFIRQISGRDIISSFAGVRTLIFHGEASPSEMSREYFISENGNSNAPLLSIYGGKLTTHRALAKKAVNKLSKNFKAMTKCRTEKLPFPGGDFLGVSLEQYLENLQIRHLWLPQSLAKRLVDSYGTNASEILRNCVALDDLGQQFAPGFYQCEIDYMINHEWAKTALDVLWRRSKMGLTCTEQQKHDIRRYLSEKIPSSALE